MFAVTVAPDAPTPAVSNNLLITIASSERTGNREASRIVARRPVAISLVTNISLTPGACDLAPFTVGGPCFVPARDADLDSGRVLAARRVGPSLVAANELGLIRVDSTTLADVVNALPLRHFSLTFGASLARSLVPPSAVPAIELTLTCVTARGNVVTIPVRRTDNARVQPNLVATTAVACSLDATNTLQLSSTVFPTGADLISLFLAACTAETPVQLGTTRVRLNTEGQIRVKARRVRPNVPLREIVTERRTDPEGTRNRLRHGLEGRMAVTADMLPVSVFVVL